MSLDLSTFFPSFNDTPFFSPCLATSYLSSDVPLKSISVWSCLCLFQSKSGLALWSPAPCCCLLVGPNVNNTICLSSNWFSNSTRITDGAGTVSSAISCLQHLIQPLPHNWHSASICWRNEWANEWMTFIVLNLENYQVRLHEWLEAIPVCCCRPTDPVSCDQNQRNQPSMLELGGILFCIWWNWGPTCKGHTANCIAVKVGKISRLIPMRFKGH